MAKLDIPVVDAFWLTRSRPDHRQVTHDNDIGNHLVHVGPEVYNVLLRQWLTVITLP